MSRLAVGAKAPDVSLIGPDGAPIQASSLWKDQLLVLYFYPKDETPGCTKEACTFRDQYEDFVAAGAKVVGVSADPPESHAKFAAKHRLPFLLLSDPTGAAQAAYGVGNLLGILKGRVTYVIDTRGVVRLSFSSAINMDAHVFEALAEIRRIATASV